MYCHSCGRKFPSDYLFCPMCGIKLDHGVSEDHQEKNDIEKTQPKMHSDHPGETSGEFENSEDKTLLNEEDGQEETQVEEAEPPDSPEHNPDPKQSEDGNEDFDLLKESSDEKEVQTHQTVEENNHADTKSELTNHREESTAGNSDKNETTDEVSQQSADSDEDVDDQSKETEIDIDHVSTEESDENDDQLNEEAGVSNHSSHENKDQSYDETLETDNKTTEDKSSLSSDEVEEGQPDDHSLPDQEEIQPHEEEEELRRQDNSAADGMASSVEQEEHTSFPNEKGSGKSLHGKISAIILVLSTLLSLGAVFYIHSQEAAINEQAARLFAEGEAAALNGQLDEAKRSLEKARELRPNQPAITDSITEVELAIAFQASFAALSEKIDNGELEEGEELLHVFQEEIAPHQGVLLAEYTSLVEEKQQQITLSKITADIEELTAINDLEKKLNALASFSSAEAEELRQQIIEKVAEISLEEASEFLENYHFSRARAMVIRGLEIAVNNSLLIELKQEISERQSAFTAAEQQRLEEAEEMAAREDQRNRTEAVHLNLFETELTEEDELYIYGEVLNQATRGIFNVTIYYSVLDQDSNYVTDGHMYVTPEYLNPNDKGTFAERISFSYENEELKVRIESITWELD